MMPRKMDLRKSRLALAILGSFTVFSLLALGVTLAGSPETSGDALPPAKQAIEDYLRSLAAQGAQDPAAKHPGGDPSLVFASPEPDVHPLARTAAGNGFIIEQTFGPPGDSEGAYLNNWYAQSDKSLIGVWAGKLVADEKQGIVTVAIFTSDGVWIRGGRFLTPSRDGAVRVVGAVGDVLTLRAEDGNEITFDADTFSFK
jgi:hypothetical protein